MDETTTPLMFADDAIAAASAAELAQRLQLVAELAQHPAINRTSIEAQLIECRELHSSLGAYLATVTL